MKKEICVVGPCLKMGGMERASANIANALYRQNLQVTYLSIFKAKPFFDLDAGIEFIEPNGFNTDKLSIFKTVKYLRLFAKTNKVKTFIAINKLYSALTVLALFGLNKKVFISERSSPLYKWPIIQELFIKIIFIFFKPAGVISQTQIASEYQKKYYGDRIPIRVIHNVLRPINLYPNIQREKIILAVGRLNDYLKGFDQLIEAFAMVKTEDWKLVFVGGEKNQGSLFDKVDAFGLGNKIIFAGADKDVDLWYARSSIFVIPSRSEGFPNALAEAMGAGLACIAFKFIAGPQDLIQNDKNGILVENGNVPALALAIEYLINNKTHREKLGHEASKIKNLLDENVITKQIIDFVF